MRRNGANFTLGQAQSNEKCNLESDYVKLFKYRKRLAANVYLIVHIVNYH